MKGGEEAEGRNVEQLGQGGGGVLTNKRKKEDVKAKERRRGEDRRG